MEILSTKYSKLSALDLHIQIAEELGYRLRRNEDQHSDFWECSTDGVKWWGQDRLSNTEDRAWLHFAQGYLPRWSEAPPKEYDGHHAGDDLKLPDHIEDMIATHLIENTKAYTGIRHFRGWLARIKAEYWLAWKRGEI
jgi:hypothetical protein